MIFRKIFNFTRKTSNMALAQPFNFKKWIDDNRHLLKPPIGNQQVYKGNDDFIVKVIEDGKPKNIYIREGEIFLLPPKVPHSPRRPANTVGLVIERYRRPGEIDGFIWHCENCGEKLYEEFFEVTDIVTQLPPVQDRFWGNPENHTCKNCGTVMEK